MLETQLALPKAEQHDGWASQKDFEQKRCSVHETRATGSRSLPVANDIIHRSSDDFSGASRRLAQSRCPDVQEAPPPPYSADRLPLPVVLPQTSKVFRGPFYSPFVRAYTPALQAHNISQNDFLAFIDGLNEAFIANPAFDGLNIAGSVMQQFHGLPPVQFAGIGISVASGFASAGTSILRTKQYVKAMNAGLFQPNGLHVNVLTTKAMMAKIGHPDQRLNLPPLDTEEPVDGRNLNQDRDAGDERLRRIFALRGYVMQLDLDVPAAVEPDNLLKRMGNAQAKRQAQKQEDKDRKHREEAIKKRDEKSRESDKKIREIERELEKEQRKMEKDLLKSKAQKEEKERRKITNEFAKKERELQQDLDKALAKKDKRSQQTEGKPSEFDKREAKIANKIRWVVVTRWDGQEEEGTDEEGVAE